MTIEAVVPNSADDAQHQLTPAPILQLGLAFWGSKTLLSAVELGLFGLLAQAPAGEAELRARLGLHARGTRDFLDALVALGMLIRDDDGAYANTPATDLFLDPAKPSYVGGLLEMANARLYPFWGRLTDGLRTGLPQNEARDGGDFFAALYADEDRLGQFLHAMTSLSAGASHAIAARFPWQDHGTVLDIGCAEGGLLVALALAHPHLRGTGLDLAPARAPFERHVASFGLAERLQFAAGDFFADPLPAADVITMGHVLHDWSLDERMQLLRSAYAALPPGGAVIVFDAIIDDERRENAFGLLMSLNMLIETQAGADYTAADCRGWLAEAGFRETRAVHLAGPDSMVIGIR
jgi:SAM-dependent methyltransferase